ncbi:unnamed protein product [Kuraishia capsulata CBS 1993]|uniref:Peroxin-7 n=1 Tax=Kuraishia capsulata CBS 1993 TaxID=1382522 RepID=W6ML16_9ASCO|nr:uncharacterized protein KUCA_T00001447001 [Kuraishia capsulata CBS 1993]CDK25477.1 unnamed protein product [Kuraishia capsulata CBS 1993]
MLSFRTTGYNGYGVRYSPFYDNKVAVATSANYGLVGNGRLYLLSINDDGSITQDNIFDTQDGLFSVAWSESHENQVLTSSGDGSISLFDITLSKFPVMNFKAHQREVFSVNWNLVEKHSFCSASWDGTVRVWSPMNSDPLLTLTSAKDHSVIASAPGSKMAPPLSAKPSLENTTNDCVYNAVFSPHDANVIISCNSASHLQIWDIRSPQPLQMDFIAHGGLETLSCDFNKYRTSVIATASVDKTIKVWDLRTISGVAHAGSPLQPHHNVGPTPLNRFIGHDFAIRNIAWSPHSGDKLLSCSYDMTCRVWNDQTDDKARFLNKTNHGQACVNVFGRHREFVVGCDWSLWGEPGWVASTGWDEMVYIWDAKRKY